MIYSLIINPGSKGTAIDQIQFMSLDALDITAFSHLRVFNHNQLTVQCNNIPFLMNYLKWDSVNCSGKTATMLADSDVFNFKHVFTIIKKQKDYADTHLSNPAIHQIYINNLEFLDRFISFFNAETKKLTDLSRGYDIILNPQQDPNLDLSQVIFNKKIKNAFNLHKWMKTTDRCLSQNEIECVELLIEGKTSKEIARNCIYPIERLRIELTL